MSSPEPENEHSDESASFGSLANDDGLPAQPPQAMGVDVPPEVEEVPVPAGAGAAAASAADDDDDDALMSLGAALYEFDPAEADFAPLQREPARRYLPDDEELPRQMYNHEETVKRYRQLLAGKIKYWDPRRQEEFDNMQEGDKPPKWDSGPLVGVEQRAQGQTTKQMLAVRDSFRRLEEVNSESRQKAMKNLVPGTPEYRQAYVEWQKPRLDEFFDEFFEGQPQLLPDAVKQARVWFKNLPQQHYESPMNYEDLSSFGNMIASFADNMEYLFNFGHTTKLAILTRVVTLSGMRYVISMRPSLLVAGQKSAAKTYAFDAIEQVSPDGMFARSTYNTIKSMTNDTDRNLKVVAIDEAHGSIIGQDTQTGDTAGEAIVKSLMTCKEVISEMLSCENGRRTLVESVSSRIGTFLLATNTEIRNPDSPVLARYIVWPVETVKEDEKDAIENKMGRFEEALRDQRTRLCVDHMKLDAFYVMLVEMAIGSGVLRDVNMDAAICYYQMFNDFLAGQGKALKDPKRKLQALEVVRTLTIMHACHVVFSSEWSRSWRHDAAGDPLRFAQFRHRALREIERRLVVTMDSAVFGFTLLGLLWTDSEWPLICNTIRDRILNIEKKNNGRSAIDLGRTNATHPLDVSVRSEMFSKLQQRITARVAKTARQFEIAGDDEDGTGAASSVRGPASLQAHGTQLEAAPAPQQQPSVFGSGAGAGAGFGQYEHRDLVQNKAIKAQEEMEMENFIRSKVSLPFHQPVTHDHEVSIDPQYIEMEPMGARFNLEGVALRIRSAQTQGTMSLENIKRVLRYMLKQEIQSRVFSYDVRSGTLYVDERFVDLRIKQPAVWMTGGDSRDIVHIEGSGRGTSRYFISTELLIEPQTMEDLFQKAVESMSYTFTLQRKLLTGLNVHARERGGSFRNKTTGKREWREMGPTRKFWEVFRCVELSATPNRRFQLVNYNRTRLTADTNLASQALGVSMTAEKLSDARELSEINMLGVINVNLDPDIIFAMRQNCVAGFPNDEWPLAVSMFVDDAIMEMRKKDRVRFPISHLRYPESKIKEIQKENMELWFRSHRPDSINYRQITDIGQINSNMILANPGYQRLIASRGGRHMHAELIWNGRRANLPSAEVEAEHLRERLSASGPESDRLVRIFDEQSNEPFAREQRFAGTLDVAQLLTGAPQPEEELFGFLKTKAPGSRKRSAFELDDDENNRKRRAEATEKLRQSNYDYTLGDLDLEDIPAQDAARPTASGSNNNNGVAPEVTEADCGAY